MYLQISEVKKKKIKKKNLRRKKSLKIFKKDKTTKLSIKDLKCYSLSFEILGGPSLTRALQF